ncbi:hypothetical protein KDX38_29075 [Pseudomonas sp. CDFA 602]|uniref:hypothetical protein n=1 Tax=Pseudomonas californiensis TaxID=2829823 RepID=UPI001E37F431|nr:hypothetical protein [Pseudomonas californiensis]MCD5997580.1 hypothetical protein [Pseudomonas californiensis]MCD6003187.1 hypothetical protein [Pseudomonas californiensis]
MKKFSYNENIDALEVSELFFTEGLKQAEKKGYKNIRVMKDSSAPASSALDLSALSEGSLIESINICSGQLIPDTTLSFSSARAGASPPLN